MAEHLNDTAAGAPVHAAAVVATSIALATGGRNVVVAAKEISGFDLKNQKENSNGDQEKGGNHSESRNQRLALFFVSD